MRRLASLTSDSEGPHAVRVYAGNRTRIHSPARYLYTTVEGYGAVGVDGLMGVRDYKTKREGPISLSGHAHEEWTMYM